MQYEVQQRDLTVASGQWPLIRYNPTLRQAYSNPLVLDSPRLRIKLKGYIDNELRTKC